MKKDPNEKDEAQELVEKLPGTAIQGEAVLEEEKFSAGAKTSKLDHLYIAYWNLLESCILAIQDEKSTTMFLTGHGYKVFMEMQDSHAEKSMDQKNVHFDNLSESTKNLIRAVIDINMQLNKAEDIMSNDLSNMYKHVANQGFQCIKQLNESIKQFRSNILNKAKNIQKDVLRDTIGNEFSQFTTKSLQTLQMWYEVQKEVHNLANKTQDPFLLGSLKMEMKNNTQDFESLKQTIMDVRTQIRYLKSNIQNVKYHVPREIRPKNNKLILRIQKHNILQRKQQEIKNGYLNPIDLAQKLRILANSENEIDSALEVINDEIDDQSSVDVDTSHIRRLMDMIEEQIEKMFDQSQKLELEVTNTKSSLISQLSKDYSREIALNITAARECIMQARKFQEEEKSKTLKSHSSYLLDYKQAEKTIVSELKNLILMNRHESLNIENCLKSVSEASMNHKVIRDTRILNEHKRILKEYMKHIKSFII